MFHKAFLKTFAVASLMVGSSVSAEIVTFDFESAVDNMDGTVSGIGGFSPAGETASLSLATAPDGSTGLQVVTGEGGDGPGDQFLILLSNFNGSPEAGSTTPFNVLLEQGGTLTGDVIIVNEGGDDVTAGDASVFLARQGSTTGFDLTDSDENDDNFNFTASQPVGVASSFSFNLPTLNGSDLTSNLDDAGGFYGISLGVNNIGTGATIIFDNVVFTPVPEPGSMALMGLGSLIMLRRRLSA